MSNNESAHEKIYVAGTLNPAIKVPMKKINLSQWMARAGHYVYTIHQDHTPITMRASIYVKVLKELEGLG